MLRIRTRLLALYAAVMIPAVLLLSVTAYSAARRALEAELSARLIGMAEVVSADFNGGPAAARLGRLTAESDRSLARLREQLQGVMREADLLRVRIVDTELRTIVDTDDDAAPFEQAFDLQADQVELQSVFESGDPASSILFTAEDGTQYKRGYAPVLDEGVVVAAIVVEGSATTYVVLEQYRLWIVGSAALTVFAVLVLTLLVSGRIAAPISQLAESAEKIGGGDLRSVVQVEGRDEIAQLAATLEAMRQALLEREEEAQLMLAGIAHEVRNPLGGMELYVGLLADEVGGTGAAEEYTGRVQRELAYLTRVVNDFLSYAREHSLTVKRAPARAFLEPVVDSVEQLAEDRGVRVTLDAPESVMIAVDVESMRGVVQNLVQNAIEACAEGAHVAVEATQDSVETVVRVRDEGCGMDEDTVRDAFRPFFTTREKGTGLGLPLARRLVERHGGSIDLDSEVGKGTQVTIRLPRRDDAPELEVTTREPQPLPDDFDGETLIG